MKTEIISIYLQILQLVIMIIGGLWIWYKFKIKRENKTAIGIDFDYRISHYVNNNAFVFLSVKLTNKGPVRIKARNKRPAYTEAGPDFDETVKYSGEIKIKKLLNCYEINKVIQWYPEKEEEDILEINYLYEYEVWDKQNTNFFIEPGEEYYLGVPLVLSPGYYLARVIFIGDKEADDEYWLRTFLLNIEIPCSEMLTEAGDPTSGAPGK